MSDVVKILVLIVVVAIVAVIVSRGAKTTDLINNAGKAFARVLQKATAPIQ